MASKYSCCFYRNLFFHFFSFPIVYRRIGFLQLKIFSDGIVSSYFYFCAD